MLDNHRMRRKADDVPPGWDYNPSTWRQRLPIIGIALIAFGAAADLSLYQLGYIAAPWEPFFGDGSKVILESSISRLVPVSDAALGAATYLADAIAGAIGGRHRWRTMPWMVILFGILVGPLGAVSVALVILQPVLFDAWCTLCLVSAAMSVLMIGPAMDEVLASLQHLRTIKRRRQSMWRAFWGLGESPPSGRLSMEHAS